MAATRMMQRPGDAAHSGVAAGVPMEMLEDVGQKITTIPEGFTAHRQIKKARLPPAHPLCCPCHAACRAACRPACHEVCIHSLLISGFGPGACRQGTCMLWRASAV